MRISDWSSDVCSSDLDVSPIRTTCPYCGVGCGVKATSGIGRAVTIEGDPDHPSNFGRLCSKGTHLGETVGLEGRLLHPMIGKRRASWDKALDLVARKFRETIDRKSTRLNSSH